MKTDNQTPLDYINQHGMMNYLRSGNADSFFLLAGPCVIEDEETPFKIACRLKEICMNLGIPFVFKGSYRKANRSRIDSFTGIGDMRALKILADIREELKVPVVTDIHESGEAAMAAQYVDILQIPAFLCRQTDLLVAAARTGKPVNIKKGQFLSPRSMCHAVEKVRSAGNSQITVTDRGTMFGYSDLVVDFRSIPEMQEACRCPVIMDVTHSLQQPNRAEGVTGGMPSMIKTVASAAVAVGADGIFMETHPDPASAKSDGANMLQLDCVEALLCRLLKIRKAVTE